MTDDPVRALMQAAYAAILREDYAERDRLLAEARQILARRETAPGFVRRATQKPIKLVQQPDGSFAPERKVN